MNKVGSAGNKQGRTLVSENTLLTGPTERAISGVSLAGDVVLPRNRKHLLKLVGWWRVAMRRGRGRSTASPSPQTLLSVRSLPFALRVPAARIAGALSDRARGARSLREFAAGVNGPTRMRISLARRAILAIPSCANCPSCQFVARRPLVSSGKSPPHSRPSRPCQEGRFAIVTNVGSGMRWARRFAA